MTLLPMNGEEYRKEHLEHMNLPEGDIFDEHMRLAKQEVQDVARLLSQSAARRSSGVVPPAEGLASLATTAMDFEGLEVIGGAQPQVGGKIVRDFMGSATSGSASSWLYDDEDDEVRRRTTCSALRRGAGGRRLRRSSGSRTCVASRSRRAGSTSALT